MIDNSIENHMVLPWADDEFVEATESDPDLQYDLDRQREAEDEADGLREALRDIGRGLETGRWSVLAHKQAG